MSMSIVTCAQRKIGSKWEDLNIPVFERRENDFDLFAFFGYPFNEGRFPPISPPRGLPDDFIDAEIFQEACDHCTWFKISELVNFDYNWTFEELRTWFEISPKSFVRGPTLSPGEGVRKSIRDSLGAHYFDDLGRLQRDGADRIIVGFA